MPGRRGHLEVLASRQSRQQLLAFGKGSKQHEDVAAGLRILYGGSVKSSSAPARLAQPDVDGARVGGASRDGHEAVLGTALMIAGGNSRTVAQAAGDRLEEVQKTLPPGIEAVTVLDRSALVNSTIATVARNLTEGALLVIVVLFLLLGNLRAASITALMIPISFLFAVIGMNRFGISGNLMSLGALDFGLLVDGAVVVVENTLLMLSQKRAEAGRMLTRHERLGVAAAAARHQPTPERREQGAGMQRTGRRRSEPAHRRHDAISGDHRSGDPELSRS